MSVSNNTNIFNTSNNMVLRSFGARLFSIFGFDNVISDTLRDDAVVKKLRGQYKGLQRVGQDNTFLYNLYEQFLGAYSSTQQMYAKMSTIRQHYIVKAIMSSLIDDCMAADPLTGNVFTIKINKDHPQSTKLTSEVEDFEKRFKLDRILSSNIDDALFYGEYFMELAGVNAGEPDTDPGKDLPTTTGTDIATDPLNPDSTVVVGGFTNKSNLKKEYPVDWKDPTDKDGETVNDLDTGLASKEPKGEPGGITDIIDSNPPGTLFGVYNNVDPQYFIRLKKQSPASYQETILEKVKPGNIWHIGIFPRKIKFSLLNNLIWERSEFEIAHHFKIGEPLFLTVYDKVLELEAFEKAQLAKDFGDLKRRGMVGVQAPQGLDLGQLKTFTQWYEKILNENNIEDLQNIQGLDGISSVVLGLSNVRVIPIQPDRGEMSRIDTTDPKADQTMEKIEDRRKIICQTIGVPYEYVFGESGRDTKVSLRSYVRYSRLCKRIQGGVSESLQRVIRTHLLNKGYDLFLDDIDVQFYNSINIAELDKLEFVDANVSLLESFNNFVNDLSEHESTSEYIDMEEKMRYFKKIFKSFEGAENIITVNDIQTVGETNEDKIKRNKKNNFVRAKFESFLGEGNPSSTNKTLFDEILQGKTRL